MDSQLTPKSFNFKADLDAILAEQAAKQRFSADLAQLQARRPAPAPVELPAFEIPPARAQRPAIPAPDPDAWYKQNIKHLSGLTRADLDKQINTERALRPRIHAFIQYQTWMDFGIKYGMDRVKFEAIDWPSHDDNVPPEQPAESLTVRLDAETGRLTIGLNLPSQLRVWTLGRHISTQLFGGQGQLPINTLRDTLPAYGKTYTPQHFNRLLRQGEGIFWRIDRNRNLIYLNGQKTVAAKLVARAKSEKPGLIETNLPGGMKDVYLPINGTHQAWESLIFAGWLAAKSDPQIKIKTLARLFGRNEKTIRRWLKNHLQGVVTRMESFKQTADQDELKPTGAKERLVMVSRPGERKGLVKQWSWQVSNIWHSSIRQHNRKGQSRKIRAAARDAAHLSTLDVGSEGDNDRQRHFFASGENLRDTVKKHGVGYGRCLLVGFDRHQNARFEPTVTGFLRTSIYAHEYRLPQTPKGKRA